MNYKDFLFFTTRYEYFLSIGDTSSLTELQRKVSGITNIPLSDVFQRCKTPPQIQLNHLKNLEQWIIDHDGELPTRDDMMFMDNFRKAICGSDNRKVYPQSLDYINNSKILNMDMFR
jgi:hypothetical protein